MPFKQGEAVEQQMEAILNAQGVAINGKVPVYDDAQIETFIYSVATKRVLPQSQDPVANGIVVDDVGVSN